MLPLYGVFRGPWASLSMVASDLDARRERYFNEFKIILRSRSRNGLDASGFRIC